MGFYEMYLSIKPDSDAELTATEEQTLEELGLQQG